MHGTGPFDSFRMLAAADVIMYLPVLRNIMGWLSAGSASYKTLKDGLTKVADTFILA